MFPERAARARDVGKKAYLLGEMVLKKKKNGCSGLVGSVHCFVTKEKGKCCELI
jgi:hypothetical protein